MSIRPPSEGWFHAPRGFERVWSGLALLWCLVMSVTMPLWHFKGKQNSTGESYKVKPVDFLQRADAFAATYKIAEDQGVAVVEPPPGGDAYLVAAMWRFYPVLKLKAGQTYRLHVSSTDVQHGLSLQPMNMNFHVIPGYDHVLTIKPTTKGTFSILCNEFCGIGHHQMTGKIIVE
jgi:cytochrome c oxidase subunit 2